MGKLIKAKTWKSFIQGEIGYILEQVDHPSEVDYGREQDSRQLIKFSRKLAK